MKRKPIFGVLNQNIYGLLVPFLVLLATVYHYVSSNKDVRNSTAENIGDELDQSTTTSPVNNRADVLSVSTKYYWYETPFIDLEKAPAHKGAFKMLPANVFSTEVSTIADTWTKIQPYTAEYVDHEENVMFNVCDSAILHAFVRHLKPKRVIEVGSGYSTRIVKNALDENDRELGVRAKHVCIEPYRAEVLANLGIETVVKPVQEVDLTLFDELESGDLLFLDNSHVVKPYGDVVYEFLWILPRLKPGVYVHIHDIFLPGDYPEAWMVDELRPYTEQYMLAAFLHNNHAWKISFMNNGHFVVPESSASHRDVCKGGFGGSMYIQRSD